MQQHQIWLLMLGLVFTLTGFCLIARYLPVPITAPIPMIRRITGCFVGFTLFCGSWVAFFACAAERPLIEDARNEFVKACTALAQATIGDASKAERIANNVCLAERMGETIEREVVKDAQALDLFQPVPPAFPDAGAQR